MAYTDPGGIGMMLAARRPRRGLVGALNQRGYGAFPTGGPVRRPVGGGFALAPPIATVANRDPYLGGQDQGLKQLPPILGGPGIVPQQKPGLPADGGGPMMGGPGMSPVPLPNPGGLSDYPWNTPQPWYLPKPNYGSRRSPMMGGVGMALAKRRYQSMGY